MAIVRASILHCEITSKLFLRNTDKVQRVQFAQRPIRMQGEGKNIHRFVNAHDSDLINNKYDGKVEKGAQR